MDEKIIVKQMIDFHKSTFQNSYNAMVMLQDQTEKMLSTFLSQANWVPQDFKKVMENGPPLTRKDATNSRSLLMRTSSAWMTIFQLQTSRRLRQSTH